MADLDALVTTLNRSAERLQTLWFTFLALMLYLAISALTTTHRMLLLEEGQLLPLLNVRLPLLAFYLVAPTLCVLMHAYILAMLVLLARTARTLDRAIDDLSSPLRTAVDKERYRMRIENSLFLQIVAGAKRERRGANGVILRAIAVATLVIAPVLLLLLFQLSFLAYHSSIATWWHRALLAVDVLLILTLWHSYLNEGGERMLPRLRPLWRCTARTAVSIAVVGFSFLIATFPSEDHSENQVAALLPTLRETMFGSPPMLIMVSDASSGWFPNRLWLPYEVLISEERLNKVLDYSKARMDKFPGFALDLSGRDLVEAYFKGSDLRSVKFDRANLSGASLAGAWIDTSSFHSTNLNSADLARVRAASVVFREASLQRAHLGIGTTLAGADLYRAKLQRAWLFGVNFDGALLDGARLEGTCASHASFQGASLTDADLRFAILDEASFFGANLYSADLRSAFVTKVDFRGANLNETDLRSAVIGDVSLWRATGVPRFTSPASIGDADFGSPPEWTRSAFERFRDRIIGLSPTADTDALSEMLKVLDPDISEPVWRIDENRWEVWRFLNEDSAAVQLAWLSVLRDGVCESGNIAVSLSRSALLAYMSAETLASFAEFFLRRDNDSDCIGKRLLSKHEFRDFCEHRRELHSCAKWLAGN